MTSIKFAEPSQQKKKKIFQVLNELEKEIQKIKNPEEKEMSSFYLKNDYYDFLNRFKDDLEIISQLSKNSKILEVGSSPYHLTYCLKKLGYNVTGVDIDPNILASFQKKHSLKIVKSDIQRDKFPFPDNTFDFIVFCEVFEHLGVNPLKTIKELRRVLKKDGILMLTTPNLYALHKSIRYLLGRGFNNPHEEFHKVETSGYMGHIREYSNREIKDILNKSGFDVRYSKFRKFNTFYKHPYLQLLPLKIAAAGLDIIMEIVPSSRPFQAVLAKKVSS